MSSQPMLKACGSQIGGGSFNCGEPMLDASTSRAEKLTLAELAAATGMEPEEARAAIEFVALGETTRDAVRLGGFASLVAGGRTWAEAAAVLRFEEGEEQPTKYRLTFGELLDHKARLLMGESGIAYKDAIRQIADRDPGLYQDHRLEGQAGSWQHKYALQVLKAREEETGS